MDLNKKIWIFTLPSTIIDRKTMEGKRRREERRNGKREDNFVVLKISWLNWILGGYKSEYNPPGLSSNYWPWKVHLLKYNNNYQPFILLIQYEII